MWTVEDMRTDFVSDSGLRVRRIGLGTMRMADRPDQRGGLTAPIWAPPTGTTDPAHLKDDLAATELELTADELATLDSVLMDQGAR